MSTMVVEVKNRLGLSIRLVSHCFGISERFLNPNNNGGITIVGSKKHDLQ